MTLNQAADRVCFALNDRFNYILRNNVKFSIKYWRAFLIRRDVAANGMSDQFLQRAYWDLEKVDKADDCAIVLGCSLLRTSNKVPVPVRLKTDIAFKFVGDVYGNPYTYCELEELKYTLSNRFTAKAIRYTTINDYIYVHNNLKLKKLAIQAIWSDPEKINTSCSTDTCFADDQEFPCGDDLMQAIIGGIINGEFKMMNPDDEEVEVDENSHQGKQ